MVKTDTEIIKELSIRQKELEQDLTVAKAKISHSNYRIEDLYKKWDFLLNMFNSLWRKLP